ncbi:MAG TPA: LuxR C-terminal-related transcriptional regulator [Steroidobacteraceae bacterium]|nr:LuxR C-terminal-related transcriptional regulator [Steroidobacteraceae bacterium]
MSFVSTAIIAPPGRKLIHRARLEASSAQIADSRLTTICAPAGSGKTVAALYWFNLLKSQGRPGLWIAARSGIGDLDSFRQALKEAGIVAGLPWADLDSSQGDVAWLERLCAPGTRKPVLVIDDAQFLQADALAFLSKAIVAARDALTTLIVSRGAIGIPLARIRSLGFLVEIGPEDLRFDREEAAMLVSRIAGMPVDAAAMDRIIVTTDGWASGLVIAGNNYRRTGRAARSNTPFDDRLQAQFTDYFNEEVLALQPPAVRHFLIDTSILDELTPAVCAALTGSQVENAHAVLDSAYRAGLFLTPIDRVHSRYAYYPLFRASVAVELTISAPARVAELHRRASRYYVEKGDGLTALRHAELSGDQEFLADQLDCLANELTYEGRLLRICELSDRLPWSVISARPMLLLALAWRRIRCLSYASAERFINAAAAIAETRPDDFTLHHLVRHRRILLDAARDDMRVVESKAQELLYDLGADQPYLSCTLLAQLMSARCELYHFRDILKLEAETHRALGRLGSQFGSIALKSAVGQTIVVQGKTALARRLLEEALATAEEYQGKGSGLAALPALPLAEVLYDLSERDRAAELIEQYMPTARVWGFVDQLAAGYIVRSKLAFARGDTAGALAGLEEAHMVAIECGLDRLRVFVVAEQVRILTKLGKSAEAQAAVRAGGIEIESDPFPASVPMRQDEFMALAWLRIELQGQRLARAERVAMRWLEFVKRSAAIRSVIMFQLIVAQIAVRRGDRSKAQRAVRNAVELAEPASWIQVFLDEGEVIWSLLREAYTFNSELETTPADIFASRLVACLPGEPGARVDQDMHEDIGPASNLSPREIDILALVGGGLRNREIGKRLGLTEGTVKWYMQQIYDKIGVRRRSQATLRARQFGILGRFHVSDIPVARARCPLA